MDCRYNNFDFFRLIAASIVLISHQFALTDRPEPCIGCQSLGGLGVLIFFSISGYLVAQSWAHDPSILRFLVRRILRIFPGFLVVMLLTTFVLGLLISIFSIKNYFSMLVHEITSLNLISKYYLPGVFTTNPLPNAVNGSLWTLPIEFVWYLLLLVMGSVGMLRCNYRNLFLVLFIVFALFVFFVSNSYHGNTHWEYIKFFGAFFIYGICMYQFQDVWMKRLKSIAFVIFVLASLFILIGNQHFVLFLILPALIIILGNMSTPILRKAGYFGDFSYGIYIYAFPVQQTIIMLGINGLSLWLECITSFFITIMLAFLSWHLVERPALKLKNTNLLFKYKSHKNRKFMDREYT